MRLDRQVEPKAVSFMPHYAEWAGGGGEEESALWGGTQQGEIQGNKGESLGSGVCMHGVPDRVEFSDQTPESKHPEPLTAAHPDMSSLSAGNSIGWPWVSPGVFPLSRVQSLGRWRTQFLGTVCVYLFG